MNRRSEGTSVPRVRPPRRSIALGQQVSLDLSSVRKVELDDEMLLKQRLICTGQDRSVVGAYKMLRTRVVQNMLKNQWSSIGITAARAGEGKTVTAINLALSLANNPDQVVVLVDFDLRRQSMSTYLGIEDRPSIHSLLEGEPLQDALLRVGDQNLYVLLHDECVENSSELLASGEVDALVQAIGKIGGIVIYDLPPLLSADDFLAFSGHVDCTMLVVAEGQTQRRDLERSKELLANTNLVGVVLNKSGEEDQFVSYYY